MEETEGRDVSGLVDHLFRHSAGRIVSSLARVFGPAELELVEDAVQEALEKALKRWPFRGIPDNPGGWLFAVARNAAIDRVRRRVRRADAADRIVTLMEAKLELMPEPVLSREIADDQLRMIFTCCHPAIPADARVALTLKTVGGFGVREIARAFLAEERTVAQRLVRAKRRIREQRIPFAMAEPEMLPVRLRSVLDVLYLMFNEGYDALNGDRFVRRDVCSEALRLAEIVAEHPETGQPECHALERVRHRQNQKGDSQGSQKVIQAMSWVKGGQPWMTRPYSEDLRERVVRVVESGTSRNAAAKQFDVSISFVVKLMQRWKQRGTIKADKYGGWKKSKLAPHGDRIRALVMENCDITIDELCVLLAAEGIEAKRSTLGDFLLAQGLSRKKRQPTPPSRSALTSRRREPLGATSNLG